jgi:hypothetical protein
LGIENIDVTFGPEQSQLKINTKLHTTQRSHFKLEYTPPSRTHRESNSFAEFVAPPGFYDQLEKVAARDEYKDYLKMPATPCDNLYGGGHRIARSSLCYQK